MEYETHELEHFLACKFHDIEDSKTLAVEGADRVHKSRGIFDGTLNSEQTSPALVRERRIGETQSSVQS